MQKKCPAGKQKSPGGANKKEKDLDTQFKIGKSKKQVIIRGFVSDG